MSTTARLRMFGGLLLVAGIAAASLIPVGLEIRTGLHWLTEHFLIYAAATAMFCVIWPRPWQVAAAFMAMAGVLEALQGLTADRTPDLPTAISGAAGVIVAALIAQFAISASERLRTGAG